MTSDDARISEIRRRHQEGPFGECETCDVLARFEALASQQQERLDALTAERDALRARAERAESERDVYRDALTLIARGVWTARNSVESIVWGARKALRDGAALAAIEGSER